MDCGDSTNRRAKIFFTGTNCISSLCSNERENYFDSSSAESCAIRLTVTLFSVDSDKRRSGAVDNVIHNTQIRKYKLCTSISVSSDIDTSILLSANVFHWLSVFVVRANQNVCIFEVREK